MNYKEKNAHQGLFIIHTFTGGTQLMFMPVFFKLQRFEDIS